jgi:hypothetical protein
MTERIIATAGDWAVGADKLQWILLRRRSQHLGGWRPVSFVSSTKDVLARCMREKGTDEDTAVKLLDGLPDTFAAWKTAQDSSQGQGEAPVGEAVPAAGAEAALT